MIYAHTCFLSQAFLSDDSLCSEGPILSPPSLFAGLFDYAHLDFFIPSLSVILTCFIIKIFRGFHYSGTYVRLLGN